MWTKSQSQVGTQTQGSKVRFFALVVLAVVVVFLLFSFFTGMNRIYSGVKIGSVDVGGMTTQEAANALQSIYGDKVANGSITIYAGEEGKAAALSGNRIENRDADRSVEDVAADTVQWSYSSKDLGIYLPAEQLAQQAYDAGRSDLLGGIKALAGMLSVDLVLGMNEQHLTDLSQAITTTMGTPLVDWGVKVEDGKATVTRGNDGVIASEEYVLSQVSDAILSSTDGKGEFVAEVTPASVRVTRENAQETADAVNNAIANGADFAYQSWSWHAERKDVGSWVVVKSEPVNNDKTRYQLVASVDPSAARADLIARMGARVDTANLTISLENKGAGVVVHPKGEGTMPDVTAAVNALNASLFQTPAKQDKSSSGSSAAAPFITIEDTNLPDNLEFEEALELGVIEEIQSFTTAYTDTAYTVARNTNIHLAADEINNTVVKANGGVWSYNDIAGDSTEEEGFMAAGTIIDGQVSESIGGGLCQVATTVFNCIYDSGFPIIERHNHSLYIASYPKGRDAAIAYNTLDLVWRNDTDSDCVLVMSYTDDTVTASLFGVNPHYKVSTEEGEWQEGKSYKVIVKHDDSLEKGEIVIDTDGTDGSEITIVRRVSDQSGTVIYTNTFRSVYDPKNAVVILGPEASFETDREVEEKDNTATKTD